MLHQFLAQHRTELAQRCRVKSGLRPGSQPTEGDLEHGIPLFIEQLIATLRTQDGSPRDPGSNASDIGASAERHGHELLRHGATVDRVIRTYGDLCQAVTELASELRAPITVDEFHTFNRCLDDAMADAVTEFGRQRDEVVSSEGQQSMNERLGSLAHELRNLLSTASLAFEAIKSGSVAVGGATGAVLERSLMGLRDLIDRSLAEVRLSEGLRVERTPIGLRTLLQEIQVSAAMGARASEQTLAIELVDDDITVRADRGMIASALSNLIQNALKFSRPRGHVSLTVQATDAQVLIEVHDECGGLPPGKIEELFQPFQQRSTDRSGLGLGLSISRRAVEANGGRLTARNVPGTGCVFTIALPRSTPVHSSSSPCLARSPP